MLHRGGIRLFSPLGKKATRILLPPSSGSLPFRPTSEPPCPRSTSSSKTSASSPLPGTSSIRFLYEPSHARLSFRTWHQRRLQRVPTSTRPEVDVMVEGRPLGGRMSRCKACTQTHTHRHTLIHTHTHARTHTHTYAHIHTHMSMYTSTHKHVHVHTHAHAHAYGHMRARSHALLHSHAYMHSHMHTRTQICTHMHTYKHMCTHAHVHTHHPTTYSHTTTTHTRMKRLQQKAGFPVSASQGGHSTRASRSAAGKVRNQARLQAATCVFHTFQMLFL